jgi:hypothetical protein
MKEVGRVKFYPLQMGVDGQSYALAFYFPKGASVPITHEDGGAPLSV